MISIRSHRALPSLAIAAAVAATIGVAAPGQAPDPAGPPVQLPAPPPITTRLVTEPMRLDGAGISIRPPASALVQTNRSGGTASTTIMEQGGYPRWSMRVQALGNTRPNLSPEGHIRDLLQAWRDSGRDFTILSSDPIDIAGVEAHLTYVRVEAGGLGDAAVTGWLVVPRPDDVLVVVACHALPDSFTEVKPILQKSFETIRFIPPDQIASEKLDRVKVGARVLAGFTSEWLDRLVGQEQWYRYYAPAAGTDEKDVELGYYSVSFRAGLSGEVDPNRSTDSYTAADRRPGLLTIVQGHYIEQDGSMTYDSDGRYWMAWDQTSEAWSIRGTSRYGEREQGDALTGVRSANGVTPGKITVVSSAQGEQKNWTTPDVYLSQPIRWALGQLLPRDEPLDMSMYCFDSSDKLTITLRVDRWEPAEDGTDAWILTSQMREGMPKRVSRYDRTGKLVRRTWANGNMAEAIELEDLHRLWKQKGLPTGPQTKRRAPGMPRP